MRASYAEYYDVPRAMLRCHIRVPNLTADLVLCWLEEPATVMGQAHGQIVLSARRWEVDPCLVHAVPHTCVEVVRWGGVAAFFPC